MKESNRMAEYKILIINPGSTSTKVAVYEGEERIAYKNISHSAETLAQFKEIPDQFEFRKQEILNTLKEMNIEISDMSAVSGITTGLLPMKGGVYHVNELMAEHGRQGIGSKHPGNLGPMLVYEISKEFSIPGFSVDPSSVDEFCDEARFTGLVEMNRVSRGHPLNQKQVARRYAKDAGKNYEDINLVVAHMGGGISVSAHCRGKMIDTVDSTNGEGRMAPTRTGALPAAPLVELCFSGRDTKKELRKRISSPGGGVDQLGTSDALEVEKMVEEGNEYAKLVLSATVYELAKDVAAMAAVMDGKVDAILLTGGIAHSKLITGMLADKVSFIAPVKIYPGEYEMEALAAGPIRVLNGEEKAMEYTGEPVFKGFSALK